MDITDKSSTRTSPTATITDRSAKKGARSRAKAKTTVAPLAALDGRNVPAPALAAFAPRIMAIVVELTKMLGVAFEGPAVRGKAPTRMIGGVECIAGPCRDQPDAEYHRWGEELLRIRGHLLRLVAGPAATRSEGEHALADLRESAPATYDAILAFACRITEGDNDLVFMAAPGDRLVGGDAIRALDDGRYSEIGGAS